MRWIICCSLFFIAVQPVTAALKKCQGDDGMTHYYANIMPPECHNKATVEMNTRGVVMRTKEAEVKTASVVDTAKQAEEEQKKMEAARRDAVLLSTYTSENEIDWALERNVHPIELNIIGIKKRLEIMKTQLQTLQQQAIEAEQSGNPNLSAIKKDMEPIARGAANLEQELSENQTRIKDLHTKFEADRKRFLEIKSSVTP